MVEPIGDNQENILEEAVQQFVHAQSRGEQPDLDEFVRQYPEIEPKLRQRIGSLETINVLFDSLVQADGNDFDDTATGQDLVGRKLAHFEICEMIGRGGMGVVYLARDSRLDRSVAVKSMPPGLVDDATARTRFQREAKLLASLNHPNIAVIHDIIEQEKLGYLVLEYVPGQTLAEEILKGPLKLQEALMVAVQIAEAVAAAHEHDVIHRDLKPGNIKITPDGRAKVLDFGLAKAVGGEPSETPPTVTQPGRVIGTPAYMSPEQARGQLADKRSDIWSFGCVLYEMLSGGAPFEGETASDTLANVLQTDPDWQALPQSTPANVRTLLRHCLEKDPGRRLQDIGDAAIEINEALNLSATATQAIVPVKPRRMAIAIALVGIAVLSTVATWFALTRTAQPPSKEIRLLVLPFDNLGSDRHEYFADSITDRITSHLAPVQGLCVLSPRTAAQYKDSERDIRTIGEEGVDFILDGKVQPDRPSDPNSRISIIPQLIRVSDDKLLFMPIRTINIEDENEFLGVQSALAEQTAQALNVSLPGSLPSRPTEDTEADSYYLRGNNFFHRSYKEEDFQIAIDMYEMAVERDPTFALAYSRLSLAHSWMYWFHDHTKERLAEARRAVDNAFQHNPALPEAYLAMGRYYYSLLDFDSALEQLATARGSLPNNSEVLSNIGFCQRRKGDFELALASIKRACELDHLSNMMNLQVGATFMLLGKYTEAERYYEQSIKLSPDIPSGYFWKAGLYLVSEGNTEKAWAVLGQAPKDALNDEWIVLRYVELCIFDGDYQKALDRLSSYESEDFDTQFYFIPKALLHGQIYGLMEDEQLQEKYYESARNILRTKIQEQPGDVQFPERFHSSLGIAHAGLGHKQDAIREGKLAVDLLPVDKDAWRGLYRVKDLARIYVMVGDFDAAIDQLRSLLSIPGGMSVPSLELDPAWEPLRDRPDFKRLVEAGR